MQHVRDFEYLGHEVVITTDGQTYTCDIRSDNFDGEFLEGYEGEQSEIDCIVLAIKYIDNLKQDIKRWPVEFYANGELQAINKLTPEQIKSITKQIKGINNV